MQLGLEAIYRRPNTSKPNPGHKVYPYLLRGLEINRVNQVSWRLLIFNTDQGSQFTSEVGNERLWRYEEVYQLSALGRSPGQVLLYETPLPFVDVVASFLRWAMGNCQWCLLPFGVSQSSSFCSFNSLKPDRCLRCPGLKSHVV